MSMYAAHIAIILEILAIAAGLIALHYAGTIQSKLIRAAGIILVVFGVLSAICTFYYSVKYYLRGDFNHAYGMHMPMGGMHMKGRMHMGKGMKQGDGMRGGMMQGDDSTPENKNADH